MSKISIITVVYNDFVHIEETIQSVLNQTFTDYEYIIIDGGSSDGTLEIIEKYKLKLDYFISEPDLGIYDAMNKGIRNSTSKWLLFLNSGDLIYDEDTIMNLNKYLSDETSDIIYGDNAVISEDLNVKFTIKANYSSGLLHGMVMNHQSSLVKRALLLENLYDLRYRIAADYHFMLKSFLAKKKFLKVPLTISTITTGGVSDSNRIKTFVETLHIKNELNPDVRNYIYFLKQALYAICIKFIKSIISKRMFVRLYKRKYAIVDNV